MTCRVPSSQNRDSNREVPINERQRGSNKFKRFAIASLPTAAFLFQNVNRSRNRDNGDRLRMSCRSDFISAESPHLYLSLIRIPCSISFNIIYSSLNLAVFQPSYLRYWHSVEDSKIFIFLLQTQNRMSPLNFTIILN